MRRESDFEEDQDADCEEEIEYEEEEEEDEDEIDSRLQLNRISAMQRDNNSPESDTDKLDIKESSQVLSKNGKKHTTKDQENIYSMKEEKRG